MERRAAYLPTEGELQDSVVQGLTALGYTVLQVGRWVRQTRCPNCNHWHTPRGGHGNTPGTPDLLVGHPDWGPVWLGVELKAPGAKTLHGTIRPGQPRKEQRDLAKQGLIVVCHSWDEVKHAVERCGHARSDERGGSGTPIPPNRQSMPTARQNAIEEVR